MTDHLFHNELASDLTTTLKQRSRILWKKSYISMETHEWGIFSAYYTPVKVTWNRLTWQLRNCRQLGLYLQNKAERQYIFLQQIDSDQTLNKHF